MTKSELITRIAGRFPKLTQPDAEMSVNLILQAIAAKLAAGDRVEIRGFGSFSAHVRPPRIGRNPKTGARVDVPSKAVPHFKPGVELRARVNQQTDMISERLVA